MVLITSKFSGRCTKCGAEHEAGDRVNWVRGLKGVTCEPCTRPKPTASAAATPKRAPKLPDHPVCKHCRAPAMFTHEAQSFCREHGFRYLTDLARPKPKQAALPGL